MRPYLVGSACHRVHEQLEHSLCDGRFDLPAELVAHAERCPNCLPQVKEVEGLFHRLRSLPAGVDLGPVPGVVDRVLQRIAQEPSATAGDSAVTSSPDTSSSVLELDLAGQGGETEPPTREEAQQARRPSQLRWLLGQVAAVAAALVIAVGGLTFVALKVNHLVSGVRPGEVVERWMAPLQNWTQAILRNTQ